MHARDACERAILVLVGLYVESIEVAYEEHGDVQAGVLGTRRTTVARETDGLANGVPGCRLGSVRGAVQCSLEDEAIAIQNAAGAVPGGQHRALAMQEHPGACVWFALRGLLERNAHDLFVDTAFHRLASDHFRAEITGRRNLLRLELHAAEAVFFPRCRPHSSKDHSQKHCQPPQGCRRRGHDVRCPTSRHGVTAPPS